MILNATSMGKGIALSILTIVLPFVFLSSCSDQPQYPPVLETADIMSYINPDSALIVLKNVEEEISVSTPAVRHLYDLLTIKAQDKAHLPLTSDSLILDVLNYYEHGGDPTKLPEAYYYAGRVFRSLGDAPQAIDYFQKALSSLNAPDLQKLPDVDAKRNEKLKGVILAQIGYLFRDQHLYPESHNYLQRAFVIDSLANDTIGMYKCMNDIGFVMQTARDNEHALHYFDKAAQMAEEYGDTTYLSNIIVHKCQSLVKLKKYDEVKKILQTFQPQITRVNKEMVYSFFGEYYWKIGESKKAVPYFKWLYDSGSIYARSNATLWFSDYETKRGNAKKALHYMAEYSNLEIELRKLQNEEVTALTNSLYNYHFREQENMRLKKNEEVLKERLSFLFAIVLLMLLALFFFVRSEHDKRRYMAWRNKQLEYLLKSLQTDKENRQNVIDLQKSNLLSSVAYQMVAQKCKENKMLKSEDWEIVETTLQKYAPDFLPKLKGVYDFNLVEWQASLLMKFGFSVPEIAIAVNRSKDGIYSLRTRLFNKVFNNNSTFGSWQEFINSL